MSYNVHKKLPQKSPVQFSLESESWLIKLSKFGPKIHHRLKMAQMAIYRPIWSHWFPPDGVPRRRLSSTSADAERRHKVGAESCRRRTYRRIEFLFRGLTLLHPEPSSSVEGILPSSERPQWRQTCSSSTGNFNNKNLLCYFIAIYLEESHWLVEMTH